MLVHFPIALLTVYALVELVRIKSIQENPQTFTLKAFLSILGALSLVITFQSGELIEHAFAVGDMALLVERHSTFALASYVLFAILAIGYLGQTLARLLPGKAFWKTVVGASVIRLSATITSKFVAPVLALIGLITLTITGALGGAIAQGPDIDPIVTLMYHLFVR